MIDLASIDIPNGYVNVMTYCVDNNLPKTADLITDMYKKISPEEGEEVSEKEIEDTEKAKQAICAAVYEYARFTPSEESEGKVLVAVKKLIAVQEIISELRDRGPIQSLKQNDLLTYTFGIICTNLLSEFLKNSGIGG